MTPVLLLASTCAIGLGSLADRVCGDPRHLPHIVRGIGSLIAVVERRLLPQQLPALVARRRGVVLVVLVVGVVTIIGVSVLAICYWISVWVGLIVEAFMCFQCLAVKSLRDESMKVASSLHAGDLAQARTDVSMIVGRDTDNLDEPGVVRAAVETVAENTSDGVVAPLLSMLCAGGLGGVVYKAINTMDSMVGYRNTRYLDFGRAAARLDDLANYVPARMAALLMVGASFAVQADAANAWRVWRRDHANHGSPNAGHTEAACAGALHVQLGGPSSYGGQRYDKPFIGDPDREILVRDIHDANRLMSATAWFALILILILRLALWGVLIHAG